MTPQLTTFLRNEKLIRNLRRENEKLSRSIDMKIEVVGMAQKRPLSRHLLSTLCGLTPQRAGEVLIQACAQGFLTPTEVRRGFTNHRHLAYIPTEIGIEAFDAYVRSQKTETGVNNGCKEER